MTTYKAFDRHEKLGDPPWEFNAVKAWEEAHGHDVRLKCYAEFGCRFADIETVAEGVVRLLRHGCGHRVWVLESEPDPFCELCRIDAPWEEIR